MLTRKLRPPSTTVLVGDEALPSPYHVQSGTLFFIGGTVDPAIAAQWLALEDLFPVLDSSGRALAGVWVGDFDKANLGSHREFQISLFARRHRSMDPVPTHPFSMLRVLLAKPEPLMVCHGLWNNTERVVRYNREHLHLNALLAEDTLQLADQSCTFSFAQTDGGKIAEGEIGITRQSAAEAWEIARHLGFKLMMKAGLAPYLEISVANTRRPDAPDAGVSRTASRCSDHVTRRFTSSDRLVIHHERYKSLGFIPLCVQRQSGFELVFPPPDKRPSGNNAARHES